MRKIKISFAAFAFAAAVIATVTANGSNLNDDPRPCNPDPQVETCKAPIGGECCVLPNNETLSFPIPE